MYTAWQEAAKKDYDFYLWLNDDTFVYPNMLSTLLQAALNKKIRPLLLEQLNLRVNNSQHMVEDSPMGKYLYLTES